MKAVLLVLLVFSVVQPGLAAENAKAKKPSDAQIRKLLIEQSIQSYPGKCPCPYSTMRNGHACGGRSAWSKPGGAAPLCYERDVTDEMIAQWRQVNS